MNCLIIGASGQVGNALIQAAKIQNWPWKGTGLKAADGTAPQPEPLDDLDILEFKALDAYVRSAKPEVVFFPAGWTWVDGCEADENRANKINAQAPAVAAKAAGEVGAGFVFYSTEYVFDGVAGPYTEEDAPAPLGAYARSKLRAEKLIQQAHPFPLILRTTVVYGPETQGKNFVYQLVRALKEGREMKIPKDQVSNPTYNYDLARASLELARFGKQGVYNVVGRDRVGRLDFAGKICEIFGLDKKLLLPVTTAELGQKSARPLNAGLKTEKLESELGWVPRGIEDGLRAMKASIEDKSRAEG